MAAYFDERGPEGETSLQAERRRAERQREWEQDYRGKGVDWWGILNDVDQEGVLYLACAGHAGGADTRVRLLPEEVAGAGGLLKGEQIRVQGRLMAWGGRYCDLTEGRIVETAPPQEADPQEVPPLPTPVPASPLPQPETGPPIPPAPQPTMKHIGQEGRLDGSGSDVPVAVDVKALDELYQVFAAGDKLGLLDLVTSGRVFGVPDNTRVLVIDRAGFLGSRLKVRILDGDQAGMAGWVPCECVK
jgi:hypothetical protein